MSARSRHRMVHRVALVTALVVAPATAQQPGADPPPAGDSQEAATELHYASVVSEVVDDEIHYDFREVLLVTPEHTLRADRAFLRLAREAYRGTLEGSRLLGDIGSELLGKPGQPVEDALILELRLQGDVRFEMANGVLRCDWVAHRPPQGVATFYRAELTLRDDLGPQGWPWRLKAEYLQEYADGTLRAQRAQLTACDLEDPAYALAMLELTGVPDGQGDYVWQPTAPWLEVGSRRILPMPAFDFRTGEEDSGFGLRSLRVSSGRQLGTAVELGFGGSTRWKGGKVDLRLEPGISSRRGFPFEVGIDFEQGSYEAEWDLFLLQDGADDVHALRNRVTRDNDLRWRLRLDNRVQLNELWRLDADLALTSDPLVDPEFFRREWVNEDDALSELYLRRNDANSHFAVRTAVRLDDTGFTPLEAYGPRGGPQPQQLDLLPRIVFEGFDRTLTRVATGGLGGRDGTSALNFNWGFDAGRFDLRSIDGIEAPDGVTDFVPRDDETRDRARLWGELSLPMHAGPVAVRPGLRAEAGAVHDASGDGGDAQSSLEAYVETSIAFERRYEGGWLHRVRPTVRLRDLRVFDRPDASWYPFELFDRRRAGQAVELSLRQFWYGPDAHRPWLDVDLLVPWYPDEDDPLADELFPTPRDGQPADSWGPAELRSVWDPGVRDGLLRGVRWKNNLRYRFDDDHLEEWYSGLSLAPATDWRLTLTQRIFDPLEDSRLAFRSTAFNADWRINETFEARAGRTISARGNATTRTRYGLVYYGHGFAFEFYTSRNDQTGESRYGVNLLPCFLVERYTGPPPPLPEDAGLE